MHNDAGLSLIQSTLQLDAGVTLSARDLVISDAIQDAGLTAIGTRILAVRGFSKWALGAVLCEMVARRPKLTPTGQPTGEHDASWALDYAEAMALDPKERREIMGVYSFYPGHVRVYGVSWEHYREAMIGVGVSPSAQTSLSRATAYLDRAENLGLSVSALRRLIRTESATDVPEPIQVEAQLTNYNAVFDFRRWATGQLAEVETYTRERAAAILADLGDAALYLKRLESIATESREMQRDCDENSRNCKKVGVFTHTPPPRQGDF